jgi:hypothetical protein
MGKSCDCEKTDLKTLRNSHFFSVFWIDIIMYVQQLDWYYSFSQPTFLILKKYNKSRLMRSPCCLCVCMRIPTPNNVSIPGNSNTAASQIVEFLLPSFLPSPWRYSSGRALASWMICFHSSLFFIFPPHLFTCILLRSSCTSSNHLSSFADVDFCSIHPRLTVWFLNNLVCTVWGC